MINFNVKLLLTVCIIAGAISLATCGIIGDDATPKEARRLRHDCKYYYEKANEAHNKMLEAEQQNDIDNYERYLEMMREYDRKWNYAVERYDEIRDYLEARIWNGELIIDGFTKRYQKGDLASILDYMTGRVKH